MKNTYYVAHQDNAGSRYYLDTTFSFIGHLYRNDVGATMEFADLNYALMIAGELDALVLVESDDGLVPV